MMNYIYIVTAAILTLALTYVLFQQFAKNSALKKQINTHLASKENLILMIESFQNQDAVYKDQIESLTCRLNEKNETYYNLKNENSGLEHSLKELKTNHQKQMTEAIAIARKDSVKRSRSVIRGQATEHLAPYILKETNPKDYRFLGNPIDYICFEGLSDVLDGISNEIVSLHFIDIKTGKASLSKSQRKIRDAIKDSRVKFSVINLDKEIEKQNDKIKNEHPTSSFEES